MDEGYRLILESPKGGAVPVRVLPGQQGTHLRFEATNPGNGHWRVRELRNFFTFASNLVTASARSLFSMLALQEFNACVIADAVR